MRILQISSHYDKGGAARIAACIHRQLLEKGQDAYTAYGRGEKPEEKNLFLFNRKEEVYLSALASRIVGLNGWWNRRATKRLLKWIEEVQPEIIHLHALHGYYVNFAMLFDMIQRRGIPCVWTFHDCHAFVGNCGYFFDCEKWKSGCGNCPYLHGYPSSYFFDFTKYMWARKKELFTAGEKMAIVTPSDWLTGIARQTFFAKYPCVTIHNGIDVQESFYPRNRDKCRKKYGFCPEDKLVLGIAAHCDDPRKGVKYMIQAARDLKGEAKVILVGWNQKDSRLLEGIDNIITVPLIKDKNTLAEYYSMADVFVLPSLAENYATVSLESMACGTPIVGFDAGGIPEQLAGGKGIVVEAGNQEAFTDAVRRGISEENHLLRGDVLAERIRQENSVEKMTEEYLELYKSLLCGEKG